MVVMPVAQGSQTDARQAILIALGGIVAFGALVFLITRLGSLGDGGTEVPIQLGEPVFQVGLAADLATAVAEQGPLLLPDASGGDRDIIVNHTGDRSDQGWVGVRRPRPHGTEGLFRGVAGRSVDLHRLL